jgi:hypothetical protein
MPLAPWSSALPDSAERSDTGDLDQWLNQAVTYSVPPHRDCPKYGAKAR